jgi:hypothetical protein
MATMGGVFPSLAEESFLANRFLLAGLLILMGAASLPQAARASAEAPPDAASQRVVPLVGWQRLRKGDKGQPAAIPSPASKMSALLGQIKKMGQEVGRGAADITSDKNNFYFLRPEARELVNELAGRGCRGEDIRPGLSALHDIWLALSTDAANAPGQLLNYIALLLPLQPDALASAPDEDVAWLATAAIEALERGLPPRYDERLYQSPAGFDEAIAVLRQALAAGAGKARAESGASWRKGILASSGLSARIVRLSQAVATISTAGATAGVRAPALQALLFLEDLLGAIKPRSAREQKIDAEWRLKLAIKLTEFDGQNETLSFLGVETLDNANFQRFFFQLAGDIDNPDLSAEDARQVSILLQFFDRFAPTAYSALARLRAGELDLDLLGAYIDAAVRAEARSDSPLAAEASQAIGRRRHGQQPDVIWPSQQDLQIARQQALAALARKHPLAARNLLRLYLTQVAASGVEPSLRGPRRAVATALYTDMEIAAKRAPAATSDKANPRQNVLLLPFIKPRARPGRVACAALFALSQ